MQVRSLSQMISFLFLLQVASRLYVAWTSDEEAGKNHARSTRLTLWPWRDSKKAKFPLMEDIFFHTRQRTFGRNGVLCFDF